MNQSLRIVLASRSPRRMEILRREGVHFESIEAAVDDAATPPQGDPREVARALAVAKAQAVAGAHVDRCRDTFVVAADTICHHQGESVGKASDPDEARTILMRMMDGAHAVVTGVAIMRHGALRTFVDEATVRLERVSAADMQRYIASGLWEGKAGAYDIEERRRAGWTVHCEGDPDTVGGLPWKRLRQVLEAWPA